MTDLTLVAGSARRYIVTLLDTQESAKPIDFTFIDTIEWEVRGGIQLMLEKSLAAGTISIINATGYDPDGNIVPQFSMSLLAVDTAPEAAYEGAPILGSTTAKKQYKHELRLKFLDGTQEVPESFMGRFTVTPTTTWEGA
jgi:hypothetical protein